MHRHLSGLACLLVLPLCLNGAVVPVTEHHGVRCVEAETLEREARITLKLLPGRNEFVVCGEERCAPVKSVVAVDGKRFVPVQDLADALGLAATFEDRERRVSLVATNRSDLGKPGAPGVGSLMPNLRFRRLDGSALTLDELRGERVLINSWASW